MGVHKSVFERYNEKLEDHEMMMGPIRGKLAVMLDLLTDALVIAGKHGIYCRNKQRPEEPALDMQAIMEQITMGKELVQSLLRELHPESASKESKESGS